MKPSKTHKYLVAVKVKKGVEFYAFKTIKDRSGFIKDLKKVNPGQEYATTTAKK